jgi:F-type H+-transporting ATPase subunit a
MAGHVLLTIFFLFTFDYLIDDINPLAIPLGIITFLVACILIVFELLVISIQAYIFTMLTAFYISESIHGHGEHDEEHEEAHTTGEHRETPHETEGLEPARA